MSLTTGARLGPYEITGAIGAGGMGEVYRVGRHDPYCYDIRRESRFS